MTTTPNRHTLSLRTLSAGAALSIAALLASTAMAQAATSDMTAPVGKAVDKSERVVSDSWITTKVKSEILANSVSKAFKVAVKTKHGAVALGGKLPSQDAIDLVKMIAEKVKGVKSVDISGLSIGA